MKANIVDRDGYECCEFDIGGATVNDFVIRAGNDPGQLRVVPMDHIKVDPDTGILEYTGPARYVQIEQRAGKS